MTCSSSLFCEEWNRSRLDVALDVAAGTGATLAAFYLGLCRLRGVLFPPAPHDHAAGGTVLLCRHDGAALILDFKPRLANRCSLGADLWQIRASILDFKPRLANRCSRWAILGRNRAVILDFRPRLANRCSQEAKTRANRASILDVRLRLTNRCSQEVKTGAIPAAQGSEALCRGRGMPDGQGLRTA